MQVVYTPASIFCLIAIVLCFLTSIVLLAFSPQLDNASNRLLGASFLCFGTTLTVIYLIYTRLILVLPHFYRLGNVCWLLYIPLSYLYVRTAVRRQSLRWRDTLHLLPAFIYLLDYSPFIFSSAAHKIPLIKADLDNLNLSSSFRQGWLFPVNFHVPARTFLTAFYWLLQVYLLGSVNATVRHQHPLWFRWQYIYNSLQLLLFLPTLLFYLTGQSLVWPTTVPPAAGMLLSCSILYLYPQILYGLEGKEKKPQPVRLKPLLDRQFLQQTNLLLEKLMEENKPFLNSNYSLKELAIDLHLAPHQASAFINQATGKNFNDYLNFRRIAYCLDIIKQGKAEHLNMHGISQLCGFNNRNTFTNAFKKVTGKLPSEYLTSPDNRSNR